MEEENGKKMTSRYEYGCTKIITRTKSHTTHFFALNRVSLVFNDNRAPGLREEDRRAILH